MCVCVCVCVCMHMYIHIYIHTLIHSGSKGGVYLWSAVGGSVWQERSSGGQAPAPPAADTPPSASLFVLLYE